MAWVTMMVMMMMAFVGMYELHKGAQVIRKGSAKGHVRTKRVQVPRRAALRSTRAWGNGVWGASCAPSMREMQIMRDANEAREGRKNVLNDLTCPRKWDVSQVYISA